MLLFGAFHLSQAQSREQRKKDSLRLDSLCRKNASLCSEYRDLVGRGSVFRNLEEKKLYPKETNCFNKKFYFSGLINNKPASGCYFVDTHNGLIAKVSDFNKSCGSIGDFQPGFELEIYSMQGDSYNYVMDKKGNKLFYKIPAMETLLDYEVKFVITSMASITHLAFEKIGDQNVPTLQYHINGSSQRAVYYLFTSEIKPELKVHNYLGVFGTGYYEDENGNTVISMLLDSDPQNYIRIDKIVDVAECFDGSSFIDQVEESARIENDLAEEKKKKLENQAANATQSLCVESRLIVELEKSILEKEEKANRLARSNSIRTNNQALMNILAEGADVIDQVMLKKLKLKLKICHINNSLNRPGDNRNKEKALMKKQCLLEAVSKLGVMESELRAIERVYASNTAKSIVEKNRYYSENIGRIDMSCGGR